MKANALLRISVMMMAMLPALATAAQKVQSPYVERGEWSLEHYGAYGWEHEDANDDYQYKSKSSVGYGLTDWWKVELEAVLEDEADGKPLFYDATELVNKF